MNTSSAYFYIIAIAIFFTLFTSFGLNIRLGDFLFISSNFGSTSDSLENTFLINHEWWRLITPTFLHFSITHLAFNCLWIYILGSKIEDCDGTLTFLTIFLICSVTSNFGEYIWSQQYFFGGLSGAIYGLLGYCFIVELGLKRSRYNLPEALYMFMFIWLIVGFTGILSIFGFGKIANTAHLVGMIIGFILGLVDKYILQRY